jgi:hypothetical protein
MSESQRAREGWIAADAMAREAEAQLNAQWERYDREGGPPPDGALIAEVSRLRSAANDRLTVALMTLRSSGKSRT